MLWRGAGPAPITKNMAIGASGFEAGGGSIVGLVTTFFFRLVARLKAEILCQIAGNVACPVQDAKDLDAVENRPIEDHVPGKAIDGKGAAARHRAAHPARPRTQAGHPG